MFKQMREKLVEDLEVGLGVPVYQQYPRRPQFPCVLVRTPFQGTMVEVPRNADGKAAPIGSYQYSLDVYVSVRMNQDDSAAELAELEELLEKVLYNASDWAMTGVNTVDLQRIDTVDYPTIIIHLAKQERLF